MRKILISPGHGAGWSTWFYGNRVDKLKILTWLPIIEALEAGVELSEDHPAVVSLLAAITDSEDFYCGGLEDLEVHEVAEDEKVFVSEYDGYESFVVRSSEVGWL